MLSAKHFDFKHFDFSTQKCNWKRTVDIRYIEHLKLDFLDSDLHMRARLYNRQLCVDGLCFIIDTFWLCYIYVWYNNHCLKT